MLSIQALEDYLSEIILTKQVAGLPFGHAHSLANQNIKNIKYIETDLKEIKKKEELLKSFYPNTNGIRKFENVGDKK